MWKNNKIVVSIVIAFGVYVIIGQIIIPMIKTAPCDYKFIDNFNERYDWMFQDTVFKQLSTFYSSGNNKSVIYGYNYRNKYRFVIWELKEQSAIKISNIQIHQNVEIKKPDFSPIFIQNLGPDPMIYSESRMCLNSSLNISIDIGLGGVISNTFTRNNYKCFSGEIGRFAIVNEDNDNQIIMSFNNEKPLLVGTYIILLKNFSSFFIIVVNPIGKNTIDKNIFNLLKL